MNDHRITELEIRFSHQDNLLEQLNKLVTEQQMTIDRLLKEVQEMRLAFHDLGQPGGAPLGSDKPPHY